MSGEQMLIAATIGLVVVTVFLAGATLLLWWEARRQRVEAGMVANPQPWEVAYGLYLAVIVENAGPSVARDVKVRWLLTRPTETEEGTLEEAVFASGFRRTILPRPKGMKLDDLAAEGAEIRVELSWRDGRRGRQTEVIDMPVEAVRAAYQQSGALPRPTMLETVTQIRDHLKAIAEKP